MLASILGNKPLLSFVAACAAFVWTAGAVAQEKNDSGPYVGGGLGQFDVTVDDLEGVTDAVRDLDADDSAWKLFFGWNGDYTVELSGFAGYVIGTLPLGIFELFGKGGYYVHDLTIDVDLNNIGPGNGDVLGSDDSGEAWVYGIGAGVTFIDHINARLEYERMDIDKVKDAYSVWLTGAWRF
jgi:opacity protein-like surface antigen